MNNDAQCPNRVPPTPCSSPMLMTTECNSSQSEPSMSCYGTSRVGKKLISGTRAEQKRNIIPSNLFRHLSNYRALRILKKDLKVFYELAVSVSELGLQRLRTRSLSLSPGWRSPNTHPRDTRANFGNTSNSRVAVEKRKRGIFLSPCALTQPSYSPLRCCLFVTVFATALVIRLCHIFESFSHQIQSFQNDRQRSDC